MNNSCNWTRQRSVCDYSCNWTRRRSVRDISYNCTRRRSVLSQEIIAQVSKHFRRSESVPSNVTRTRLIASANTYPMVCLWALFWDHHYSIHSKLQDNFTLWMILITHGKFWYETLRKYENSLSNIKLRLDANELLLHIFKTKYM